MRLLRAYRTPRHRLRLLNRRRRARLSNKTRPPQHREPCSEAVVTYFFNSMSRVSLQHGYRVPAHASPARGPAAAPAASRVCQRCCCALLSEQHCSREGRATVGGVHHRAPGSEADAFGCTSHSRIDEAVLRLRGEAQGTGPGGRSCSGAPPNMFSFSRLALLFPGSDLSTPGVC
jgi:hypothetical protein